MGPEDWSEAKLGEIVEVRKGRSGGRLESDDHDETAVPYLGAAAIDGSGQDQEEFVRFEEDLVIASPTDVVILWDGERSGLSRSGLTGAVGSTAARLRPDPSLVVPDYLAAWMKRSYRWIQAHRTGQAVPHVPKDIGSRLSVALPPLPEQKKIAAILSSVDDAIEAIREVIEQTKRVKKGL